MFRILHTTLDGSDDRMALALCVSNPISGVRYTLSFGLARTTSSPVEDNDTYARRIENYRRSIELSANP